MVNLNRIGLIIPSSNRLTEPQMQRYAPEGVQVHVTRLRMTGLHRVGLAELMPRIVAATLALDDAHCDAIVFHCTASSMEEGLSGEAAVLEAMRGACSAFVMTTATACVAALRVLGLQRVAVFSPYVEATHAHEVAFLSEAGFSVVGGRCLGLRGGDEYIEVLPSEWVALAASETPELADGVFLSCTNIRGIEVIEEVEAVLGRPVVTSNQAVLWYALRACGVMGRVEGLGQLLQVDAALAAG